MRYQKALCVLLLFFKVGATQDNSTAPRFYFGGIDAEQVLGYDRLTGPMTVLMPSRDALDRANIDIDTLMEDKLRFYEFVQRHIVWGIELTRGSNYNGRMVTTMSGEVLTFKYDESSRVFSIVDEDEDENEEIEVSFWDYYYSYVTHRIERVLQGPNMAPHEMVGIDTVGSPQYMRAIDKFGLLSSLPVDEPFTLFVPTDPAIWEQRISPEILDQRVCASMIFHAHAVPGRQISLGSSIEGLRFPRMKGEDLRMRRDRAFGNPDGDDYTVGVSGSKAAIVEADVRVRRSLITAHVINGLLSVQMNSDSDMSIFRTESSFLQMFIDSDFARVVEGEGRYTLFVPSNDALTANGIDRLSREAQQSLIRSHVVMRSVWASRGFDGQAEALGGNTLTFISCSDDGLAVNSRGKDAVIIEANIRKGEINPSVMGIIHVIDNVFEAAGATPRASMVLTACLALLLAASP